MSHQGSTPGRALVWPARCSVAMRRGGGGACAPDLPLLPTGETVGREAGDVPATRERRGVAQAATPASCLAAARIPPCDALARPLRPVGGPMASPPPPRAASGGSPGGGSGADAAERGVATPAAPSREPPCHRSEASRGRAGREYRARGPLAAQRLRGAKEVASCRIGLTTSGACWTEDDGGAAPLEEVPAVDAAREGTCRPISRSISAPWPVPSAASSNRRRAIASAPSRVRASCSSCHGPTYIADSLPNPVRPARRAALQAAGQVLGFARCATPQRGAPAANSPASPGQRTHSRAGEPRQSAARQRALRATTVAVAQFAALSTEFVVIGRQQQKLGRALSWERSDDSEGAPSPRGRRHPVGRAATQHQPDCCLCAPLRRTWSCLMPGTTMRRCRFLAPSLRGSLRAAFSSDGKRAAVLREGGAIDLWQADAGAASRGDWLRVSVSRSKQTANFAGAHTPRQLAARSPAGWTNEPTHAQLCGVPSLHAWCLPTPLERHRRLSRLVHLRP